MINLRGDCATPWLPAPRSSTKTSLVGNDSAWWMASDYKSDERQGALWRLTDVSMAIRCSGVAPSGGGTPAKDGAKAAQRGSDIAPVSVNCELGVLRRRGQVHERVRSPRAAALVSARRPRAPLASRSTVSASEGAGPDAQQALVVSLPPERTRVSGSIGDEGKRHAGSTADGSVWGSRADAGASPKIRTMQPAHIRLLKRHVMRAHAQPVPNPATAASAPQSRITAASAPPPQTMAASALQPQIMAGRRLNPKSWLPWRLNLKPWLL